YRAVFLFCFFFFFFQAEDGIRDFHVTGVQTCALPISMRSGAASSTVTSSASSWLRCRRRTRYSTSSPGNAPATNTVLPAPRITRSEERRVGKECRSRWWAGDERKTKKRQRR